ncbi:hypothetical protein OMCYN_00461 [cyanobiont of Ornithocercus magnificus]|nr:hypothetical protein OMCYN_00461 [cyanobiont of Ornithocercus magnificus]
MHGLFNSIPLIWKQLPIVLGFALISLTGGRKNRQIHMLEASPAVPGSLVSDDVGCLPKV